MDNEYPTLSSLLDIRRGLDLLSSTHTGPLQPGTTPRRRRPTDPSSAAALCVRWRIRIEGFRAELPEGQRLRILYRDGKREIGVAEFDPVGPSDIEVSGVDAAGVTCRALVQSSAFKLLLEPVGDSRPRIAFGFQPDGR